MKKLILALLAVLTGGAVFVGAGLAGTAAAAVDVKSEETTSQVQTSTPAATPPAVTYKYVAQPGDSYTHLSRKAVQTYGKKYKVQITQAAIIFAETNMVQAAGSPQLNEGQAVEIAEDTVKGWVEQAKNLTPEQQAAWDYYVQFVDFNTDNVGEVR